MAINPARPRGERLLHAAAVFLLLLLVSFAVAGKLPSLRAADPPPAASPHASQASGSYLPLSFEPNQGQAGGDAKYLARGKGYTVRFTTNAVELSLQKPGARSQKSGGGGEQTEPVSPASLTAEHSVGEGSLRMGLVGANPKASLHRIAELPGKSNYFIGSNPAKWQTDVPNYARVEGPAVYPGIDLVYHGNQGQLEYDFVVALRAKAGAIRLDIGTTLPEAQQGRWSPTCLRLDPSGDLVIVIAGGELRLRKPVAYQTGTRGAKHYVEAGYILRRGKSSVGRRQSLIAFRLAPYDKTRPLTIDPTLTYSTYLGSSQGDAGYGIAVDSSGNTYIVGQTCSTDFPTLGPEQPTSSGNCDVFVTKLNSTGTALIYSTYLGGSSGDQAKGIAIDSSGNAYITGITNSTNFPTTAGAFQRAFGGGDTDAFVAELNASGSSLAYSSYLGGNENEGMGGIAVDTAGNAYVTGSTASDDSSFPVANTDIQGACIGYKANGTSPMPPNCPPYILGEATTDAFVTKFTPDGSSLVYSTYLGGTDSDVGTGIAVDTLRAAYVAGWTISTDFHFPPNGAAFQPAYAGNTDAFVLKIDPSGSSLVYATYLGGSGQDQAMAIVVDINGVAYVTGETASSNFPTERAIQPTLSGPLNYPGDAFISKVNAFGSGLIYSS